MDLFSEEITGNINLLPYDGIVHYHGKICSDDAANIYLHELLTNIAWRNDEAVIFGKHIITKRKVAWYGDTAFGYTYSNITRQALPWTNALLDLKKMTEAITGATYNSCLLNLYHTGEEGMAWHSDDEKGLLQNGSIASLSFGAARKFAFRHKQTKETIALVLTHGSLLEMKGPTQTNWLHKLPTTTKINEPRINLTFRTITSQ